MDIHNISRLSDTEAPLHGQGGSAGNGSETFHSAQSPLISAAFLVEAMGNAARNHSSLSGQPQDAVYCMCAIYYAYYLLIYVDQ